MVAPAPSSSRKPAALTFTDAAASVMTGLAALVAMRDVAQVARGTRVLINGASGGVGTMAVQIAKPAGRRSHRRVRHPATSNWSAPRGRPRHRLHEGGLHPGRQRFDVVLDNVLNHPPKATARVLAPKGMFIPNSIGYTGGLLAGLPRTARAVLMGLGSTTVKLVTPAVNRENLDALRSSSNPARSRWSSTRPTRSTRRRAPSRTCWRITPSGKIAITA